MAVDVDKILGLLDQTYINRAVLQQHDVARETFKLPTMVVRDHAEFKYLLTAYIEHHLRTTGEGAPGAAAAFGEAKRILDRAFNEDPYQDGYARALQMALDGNQGGMRAVLNAIADTLRQRALADYMDHVYYQHINVLSKDDNRALSRAFYARFGPILKRFGHEVDEDTFAWNTRAALDYHRQILEHISGIAKKL